MQDDAFAPFSVSYQDEAPSQMISGSLVSSYQDLEAREYYSGVLVAFALLYLDEQAAALA